MKKLLFAAAVACMAVFTSCEKQGVSHTGDETGILYGVWELQTKVVTIETNNGGEAKNSSETTDFKGDHFMLRLYEPRLAFAQEGSIFTFDIDDVDAVTFAYNAEENKITFNKMLRLSKGFLSAKVMTLYGTFDVLELTDKKMVLRQSETASLGEVSGTQTTTYTYSKVASESTE